MAISRMAPSHFLWKKPYKCWDTMSQLCRLRLKHPSNDLKISSTQLSNDLGITSIQRLNYLRKTLKQVSYDRRMSSTQRKSYLGTTSIQSLTTSDNIKTSLKRRLDNFNTTLKLPQNNLETTSNQLPKQLLNNLNITFKVPYNFLRVRLKQNQSELLVSKFRYNVVEGTSNACVEDDFRTRMKLVANKVQQTEVV